MPVINVEGLTKRYGDHTAVDGISFSVEQGEIFGILGPNGAGKTTTVECVEGLRRPDEGTVRVLGMDPATDRRVRNVLGAQLQESRMPDAVRVGEAVRLYRSFYPAGADPDRLLDDLGLGGKRDAKYEDLSGGQQQRLSIALALVGNPRIAILDELTTGLDPQSRRDTWGLIEQIRNAGVTIVLVTHFMEEAEHLCDRIAIVDGGRIVAEDTPDGLVRRVSVKQRMRFTTQGWFDRAVLHGLPEVTDVRAEGEHTVVTGTGNLLHAVTKQLLEHDVVVTSTQMDSASLDDAFLALTGKSFEGEKQS